MARSFLAENLSSLPSDVAEEIVASLPDPRVSFRPARSHDLVPVVSGDRARPLHSLVSPREEANHTVRRLERCAPPVFVVAVGLGAGYHLRRLPRQPWVSSVVVVEPALGILRAVVERIDLTDFFSHPKVRLVPVAGTPRSEQAILDAYHPLFSGNIHTIPLRALAAIEPRSVNAAVSAIERAVASASGDFSTQGAFGRQWLRNALFNIPRIAGANPSLPLRSPRRPQRSKALVTAAGPSLEDEIPRIRSTQRCGDTLIIATDTSLPALRSAGIEPDFLIMIDSQMISYHHLLGGVSEKTLCVFELSVPPAVVRLVPRYLFVAGTHPFSRYVSLFPGGPPAIDTTGGNVTHAAVDLARRLGVDKVFLVGADFSYPSGKPYARGTYVYPYVHARSHRTRRSLTQLMELVFRDPLATRRRTNGALVYVPHTMERYRKAVAALLCTPPPRAEIKRNPLQPFDWHGALHRYLRSLHALPVIGENIADYLGRLTPESRRIIATILPSAVFFLQKGLDARTALSRSVSTAVRYCDWVVREFS